MKQIDAIELANEIKKQLLSIPKYSKQNINYECVVSNLNSPYATFNFTLNNQKFKVSIEEI